jgi:hypothetical protein
MKVPGLASWDKFTNTHGGKHSYSIYLDHPAAAFCTLTGGRFQCRIVPIERQGRFMFYVLQVFPDVLSGYGRTIPGYWSGSCRNG